MFTKIQQRIEIYLIAEKNLSAEELEDVGTHVLSSLENKELVHRGINKDVNYFGTIDNCYLAY